MADIKAVENMIRDIINEINVMKGEEIQVEGGATKIHPEAAGQLVKRLKELAKKVGKK